MIGRLISGVGLAALKGEATARAERAGKRAALYAVAAVLWIVALGFLVAALTIWLAGQLGGVAACIIIAAALAVIGLIVQLVLAMTARRRPQSAINLSAPGLSAADPTAASGADIGALAVVAIVGWLLGRQMTRK